jgi:hypothetical protein
VIGAGENSVDPSMNRAFVDPTAALVDSHLAKLGYKSLPRFDGKTPYLAGSAATKQAIMDALNEMEKITGAQDYGIIYYVGHGTIALSNTDLTLGVFDRPIARDEGIRVSDILGTLEFADWRGDITDIPHYSLVLDACFSGNSTLGNTDIVTTTNNVQRLQQIQNQIVPPQIAIIAATSNGDSTSAYELTGTNASAFGYYFARGLAEDWACSDQITPDGILTLDELQVYIRDRLKLAADKGATVKLMVPTMLNKDRNAFIAYDATKHAIDGLRGEIITVAIQLTGETKTAEVTLPSGKQLVCQVHGSPCEAQLSSSLVGNITVKSTTKDFGPEGVFLGVGPPAIVKFGSLSLQQLKEQGIASVEGVLLRVKL